MIAPGAPPPPVWILALLPFWIVGLSLFVLFLISFRWRKLAASYAVEITPPGQLFPITSIALGGINYNNCLGIVIADAGLCLVPSLIIRPASRTVLVPWSAFGTAEERQGFLQTQLILPIQLKDQSILVLKVFNPQIRAAIAAKLQEWQAAAPLSSASPYSKSDS